MHNKKCISSMILATFFLFLTVSLLMGNAFAASPIPGVLQEVETHLGKVTVRIVGENVPGKIPVICIPGMNSALADEWAKVAGPLSEHGFVSAIIHFHSNPRTAPALLVGGIQPHDVSKIINEAVLTGIFHAEKAVILGKSWGGYMAFTHVTNHPDKVIKLALQAPGFSTSERIAALHKTHIPTFLAWAKDDSVVWYSTHKTWQDIMGADLTFYAAEAGGHVIIDEYAKPILDFLLT